ncbi:TcmI family type II polyketide cyclase [Streptomyces coacervatus]|uniref:TcmI family type II polyketide cyclase n=1 Tax=Streptomyces coacervatus TaxID=647381 RepID=A0ABP7HWI0_9ACTN|nr:TcmI family type II polyketide cyclase [Streptomyces coacervatus]MDF2267205.1 TcmI family type II polyketide cyclase [Streptomyces coacervatus]
MNRSLIIARIAPGTEAEVARVFAASDATDLPRDIGVRERSLYSLGDLYVHLVEFDRDTEDAMAVAQQLPGFRDISRQLDPFISAYDPQTWRSPKDAMARRFYHWQP